MLRSGAAHRTLQVPALHHARAVRQLEAAVGLCRGPAQGPAAALLHEPLPLALDALALAVRGLPLPRAARGLCAALPAIGLVPVQHRRDVVRVAVDVEGDARHRASLRASAVTRLLKKTDSS